MSSSICLRDLLETRHFHENCQLAAGKNGLFNRVEWVHVLENCDTVETQISGNELILTTGVCFTSKEIALKFLQQLIDHGVSGLCIETAMYYRQVDQELIDLAEQHDFPLIVINKFTRFVDICRELNTMIHSLSNAAE
jgi:PucR family transcriptional regulator, purine catabolism regulatory protein